MLAQSTLIFHKLIQSPAMNLAATMTQSALKWPHKTALVFEGRRWTYGQWNAWVNQAASAFAQSGVVKGDRVAFLTYNLPEQITGFYALMKLGAIPVPINYRLAPNEVKYIIEDCGARSVRYAVVLSAGFAEAEGRGDEERGFGA
jgi:acyl-CoA synthetase (AMP-forming)/AMP-acid ligase II